MKPTPDMWPMPAPIGGVNGGKPREISHTTEVVANLAATLYVGMVVGSTTEAVKMAYQFLDAAMDEDSKRGGR